VQLVRDGAGSSGAAAAEARDAGARRGDLVEAERTAREAVAVAAQQEFVDARGESLIALGQALRAAGREVEGTAALRRKLAVWEAKGNVRASARTRALLDGALDLDESSGVASFGKVDLKETL